MATAIHLDMTLPRRSAGDLSGDLLACGDHADGLVSGLGVNAATAKRPAYFCDRPGRRAAWLPFRSLREKPETILVHVSTWSASEGGSIPCGVYDHAYDRLHVPWDLTRVKDEKRSKDMSGVSSSRRRFLVGGTFCRDRRSDRQHIRA